MSLSVQGASSAAVATPAVVSPAPRDAFKPLAQALRAGDLTAARSAYADIVKQAPEGATFKPGSPFAEMGKALLQGDVDAAKVDFRAMVKGALTQPPIVSPPPAPAPVSSSTGGVAGSLLNTVA
jgi:hypothetical protein